MKTVNRNIPLYAFGSALLIVAGMSVISYFSVVGFADRAQWVQHTQEVLRETESLLSDLKDLETGDRGFVISGNEAFLTPYFEARDRIPVRLQQLKDLTKDNAIQQETVRKLESMVILRTRLAAQFLESAAANRLAVPEAATRHMAAGKDAMDAIRETIALMQAREEKLLAQRAADSRKSSLWTITVIALGTLASLTMLIAAYLLLRREIAQRQRAESEAHKSAVETESLYNGAPCGYHSVDKDGYFVRINDTELSWLGYAREEVIGKKKFIDIVAPAYRQTVQENFPRLLNGGDTTNLEYELVRRDGTSFHVAVNALPLLDAQGQFLMSRTTMFDISALRATRNKLQETLTFVDAIVENIPSMLFVKDAQSLRFVRINEAEEKLLGVSRQELIGKSDHDLFPKEQADFFVSKDREALAREDEVNIDEEMLTTSSGTLTLRTRKIGIRDATGKPQYLLGISDDITEQKRSEAAIRALNASLEQRASQLEAANKELESFSYSVSHDLRAPLRAIDGFSKIFEEDYGARTDDEGRRLLKVIRDNTQRMGMLIDDLLAFSRLGRQALSTQRVDMKALAATVVDEARATERGTPAKVTIEDMPAAVADPVLMRQVWVNLISNAIKYSSTREAPEVRVGVTPNGKGPGDIAYYVKDNGVGFDMRYYDKLFGVFQRLHRTDEFAGTGVGLAIVHRLVTRHGGRVWGEGEPEKGATFYFSLPDGGTQDGRI